MALLNVVNPLAYRDWDNWAVQLSGVTAFHSSQWARVLLESYGYRPSYFTDGPGGDGRILVPVMEISSLITGKRGVSLPFSDVCRALIPEGTDGAEVRNEIIGYGRQCRWKFIEFRDDTLFPGEASLPHFLYAHHIDLVRDMEPHRRTIKHSTRASINKSVRSGVGFSTTRSSEGMEVFYRLNCITRKKHGLPPQPLIFFRKVHEHLISKNFARVMEATYRGETIAAAICFHFGKDAIMKYAAFDERFQDVRPNNLLVWETIQWYAHAGYDRLSFGRSDVANEGLRRFKVGWNLNETSLRYHKYDLKADRCVEDSGLFENMGEPRMHKVPIPLLRMMGRILYRHIG